ncbi:MAG: hypothetical protein Q7U56_08800 [Humidesulfovibrio sp.]|nr:hypothetical protein [Humidesulfovibrio sp.]
MYMDEENHSPSLFGFDLFHLISLHIHTRGFSLAILPNWFWVNVGFHSFGVLLAGSIAGRGFDSNRSWREGLPAGTKWFHYELEANALHVRVGTMYYILDRKPALGKEATSA